MNGRDRCAAEGRKFKTVCRDEYERFLADYGHYEVVHSDMEQRPFADKLHAEVRVIDPSISMRPAYTIAKALHVRETGQWRYLIKENAKRVRESFYRARRVQRGQEVAEGHVRHAKQWRPPEERMHPDVVYQAVLDLVEEAGYHITLDGFELVDYEDNVSKTHSYRGLGR